MEGEPPPLTLELDAGSLEILHRLRGDMSPSAFIRLLLQIADSRAVGPPETPGRP